MAQSIHRIQHLCSPMLISRRLLQVLRTSLFWSVYIGYVFNGSRTHKVCSPLARCHEPVFYNDQFIVDLQSRSRLCSCKRRQRTFIYHRCILWHAAWRTLEPRCCFPEQHFGHFSLGGKCAVGIHCEYRCTISNIQVTSVQPEATDIAWYNHVAFVH